MKPLGVIMAGGRSLRYGAPKALATVGGRSILERVRSALAEVTNDIVLVANDAESFAGAALPTRPDVRPGTGVLGGILTALLWARESDRAGALVVACDMPFVSPVLLAEIVRRADAIGRAGAGERTAGDVVAPESGGRRGIEPLCAWYGMGCIEPVARALDRGDRRVIAFFEDVRVNRIALDEIRRFGDPTVLFMNVNTPDERERAERVAAGEAA